MAGRRAEKAAAMQKQSPPTNLHVIALVNTCQSHAAECDPDFSPTIEVLQKRSFCNAFINPSSLSNAHDSHINNGNHGWRH